MQILLAKSRLKVPVNPASLLRCFPCISTSAATQHEPLAVATATPSEPLLVHAGTTSSSSTEAMDDVRWLKPLS